MRFVCDFSMVILEKIVYTCMRYHQFYQEEDKLHACYFDSLI